MSAVQAIYHELVVFAAVCFLLSSLDELVIDALYVWARVTGRTRHPVPPACLLETGGGALAPLPEAAAPGRAMHPPAAVLVPAWDEALVIGATIRHMRAAWSDERPVIFVGCYANDPATVAAARTAGMGDGPEVRLVRLERAGPTSKADCLNHLFAALCAHEAERGERFGFVVLHDAEDMVDPAALTVMRDALARCDFVQLPVLALPQAQSRWIAGHYCDEFAEAHAKTMVVRDALGAALPAAGVGCAIGRTMLDRLAETHPGHGPFGAGSLVEDYECGLEIARLGGRSRFVRVRRADGRLVATRAYFPATLTAAVRQKTRWTHGIAFQGWDRIGWPGRLRDRYMLARDRRGPLGAGLLALAYGLLVLTGAGLVLREAGLVPPLSLTPGMRVLLTVNGAFLLWRAALRAMFTAREHGWREGVRAIGRIVIANIIAIMSARRALAAYLRALRGGEVRWDKTEHTHHPASLLPLRQAA
ncbi:glycosyl transferase family protein [Erythrobacteraceae bacterium CFH 75059]|uniref:glycosyl transferase family protein n=1 Tax=Qipengyuania thermophila TaxID=2509361 RepID=UPI00102244A9|nr:glycosyl transferase family protein [Qipengyuania thermophila]TCD02041.1 glycosyl transferase family protein [Erythrobacteraceae bacterium CFH 75059]